MSANKIINEQICRLQQKIAANNQEALELEEQLRHAEESAEDMLRLNREHFELANIKELLATAEYENTVFTVAQIKDAMKIGN